MTSERDIERVLDRWFADRSTEVADRVVDEVADRIGRQPQQPTWRVSWRDSPVNTYLKPLLAIAAIVVVAVAGFAVLRPSGAGVGGPTETTSAPPSLRPAAPPLPNGVLEARDYVARAVAGDPMAFTITAPEGWSGFGGFFIGGPRSSSAPDGIGISFNHDPEVVTDPCDSSTHTPPPGSDGPSVDDLVAELVAREDLQVSGVTDTTLAGYSGKRLDLQLPDEQPCSYYVFAEPKGLYANGPANRWRVWLLDVEGETAVVILLDYAATPAEDRAAAEAAIDSIRITP
jgi:hypothetical protein